VRSSKVTQDMREGFLKGLKTLNRELDSAIERFEAKTEGPAANETPAAETPNDPSI
jgi:hypothetical protein